jgi:acetyl-CoA decarbonylase/synthase complex subunit gamma
LAIKGTDIKKILPEEGTKNCKECGFPTCFAFAMKVAKAEIEVEKCPYLESGAKDKIKEALTPPMALVTIGQGQSSFEIGQEEVIYRHEKSFFRKPGIAILISDLDTDDGIDRKLEGVERAVFERAQVILKPDLLALSFDSRSRDRFERIVKKAHDRLPMTAVIISEDLEALFQARDIYNDRDPVLYPVTEKNIDEVLSRIKAAPTPLGLKSDGIGGLISLTEKCKAAEISQLVLDPSSKNLIEAIRDQTILRRAALKQGNRALGYPALAFPVRLAKNNLEEILFASALEAKYAGIVVVSSTAKKHLYPLLVHREDIYADPRKLRTVEAKVYLINSPGDDAPVLVTTNFALTYFIISSAAESSHIPVYLAVVDTGGFGVDTALADGRFHGQAIRDLFNKHRMNETIKTKRLILPSAAARVKDEIKDHLIDWEVFIGPKEANLLPGFLVSQSEEWGINRG